MKRVQLLSILGGLFVAALFAAPSAEAAIRTVQPGDDLYKMFGSRGYEVCRINRLANCNLVYPGQQLDDGLGGSQSRVAGVSTSQPAYSAPAPTQSVSRGSGGPNGYGVGWCTWWVKNKRPDIGGYWGNAGYNWITAAQNAGFRTGSYPVAGAIGVMPGHVVYIESVSGNMVNISEMGYNYVRGIVTYRTVPASSFTYIY